MRTFIAIELPEEIKSEIFHNFEKLEETGLVGRFTEKNQIHLTLKFIGDISEEKIEEIKEKLSGINSKKFNAKLGEVGFFPDKDHIKVVWIGLISEEISKLHKLIDENLNELGIQKEDKEFTSHITIARVEKIKNKSLFMEKLKSIHVKKLEFSVKDFSFMKSEFKGKGHIYKTLMKFPLN